MSDAPHISPTPKTAPDARNDTSRTRSKRHHRLRATVLLAVSLLSAYLVLAYFVIPAFWKMHERRHPSLDSVPRVAETKSKIPGDPLNVSLIGTETQVKQLMLAAKWFPADPITLESCLKMTKASALKREYDDAPVSGLYLYGRKQDLAFQQPVGSNPRQRHHVRFWQSDQADPDGRPVWVGSATYDQKVGFGHETGQITHHIAADVDAERDKLFSDIRATGGLSEEYTIEKFQTVLSGRNGGGDPWHTDGNMRVGVIAAGTTPASQPSEAH